MYAIPRRPQNQIGVASGFPRNRSLGWCGRLQRRRHTAGMADAQQQTLLSRAADGSATEEQRRDALTALQGQLSGGAEEDGGCAV